MALEGLAWKHENIGVGLTCQTNYHTCLFVALQSLLNGYWCRFASNPCACIGLFGKIRMSVHLTCLYVQDISLSFDKVWCTKHLLGTQ